MNLFKTTVEPENVTLHSLHLQLMFTSQYKVANILLPLNLHVIFAMLAALAVDESSHYYDNQYNQEHPANYGYHYNSCNCSTHTGTTSCTTCRNQIVI